MTAAPSRAGAGRSGGRCVSVYDKTGLEELVRALGAAGVEIVSTGKTADAGRVARRRR